MKKSSRLTEKEFKEWFISEIGIDFDSDQFQKAYEVSVSSIFASAKRHIFFRELGSRLKEWEQAYIGDGRFSLYMLETDDEERPKVELQEKTYSSMVNKTYRYNCLNNKDFKEKKPPSYEWSPIKSWLTPHNWFQVINDTVRTMIICKYIDGPKYLSGKLDSWANENDLETRIESREKEDGYYAYHFYVKIPATVYENGSYETRNVEIEIQLTTQLQEALYQIAHHQYELSRVFLEEDEKDKDKSESWKWDYRSHKFKISYMSHTLHMLEAFILDMRDSI